MKRNDWAVQLPVHCGVSSWPKVAHRQWLWANIKALTTGKLKHTHCIKMSKQKPNILSSWQTHSAATSVCSRAWLSSVRSPLVCADTTNEVRAKALARTADHHAFWPGRKNNNSCVCDVRLDASICWILSQLPQAGLWSGVGEDQCRLALLTIPLFWQISDSTQSGILWRYLPSLDQRNRADFNF